MQKLPQKCGSFCRSQSARFLPKKNRATVPGPVWLPMTGPMLSSRTGPSILGKAASTMAVCPGWVSTEFFDHAVHDDTVSYYNRYYQPEDVVALHGQSYPAYFRNH